ncbi:DoxX family protein [Paucibacter sp. APW11]|uniref:DoxX family protein n=1 Tax=Roseateles aquae TaxID=3077235 RepID=A0ABU3PBY1_9BURK|nr:DoxX family protein [Paucibacter sp. APW11]MDT9000071.1 DoxX family protein [Paucibacter sp. APW11]
MDKLQLYFLARALVASVFVAMGLERLLAYGGVLDGGVASLGAGYLAFGLFELAAGLLIVCGWQAGWAALVMAAFLAVDACLAHPFWREQGLQRHGQLLHFMKNLSAIGGLLLVAQAEWQRRLPPA